MNKLIPVILLSAILLSATFVSFHYADALKKKEKKALKTIDKALIRATEGKPSTIDMLNISKFNDNSTIVVINKTGNQTVPIPVPPPNPPGPTPTPTPGPNTTKTVTKACFVGDLSGSAVPNAMKSCDFKAGLGDLGYGSNLDYFKSLKFNVCVIGNHDSNEDGSGNIIAQALDYCGDHWKTTIANGTTLIIGLNTNGEQGIQLEYYKNTISALDSKVKNVIVLTHKNGHVFNGAHHPAEAASLYAAIEAIQLPTDVKLYEINGHNHDMASNQNGLWFISGGGGKSHYNCGTGNGFNFCDNTKYGYLQLEINNSNGNVEKANFLDTSNKVVS